MGTAGRMERAGIFGGSVFVRLHDKVMVSMFFFVCRHSLHNTILTK